MSEPTFTERATLVLVGWFIGWFCAGVLALLTIGGCAARAPTLPGVLPVAITAWPSPIKPQCQLSDLPQVPDVFVWTQIADEEASRIYISQRQLADLVVWMKDVHHWAGLYQRCVERLVAP